MTTRLDKSLLDPAPPPPEPYEARWPHGHGITYAGPIPRPVGMVCEFQHYALGECHTCGGEMGGLGYRTVAETDLLVCHVCWTERQTK